MKRDNNSTYFSDWTTQKLKKEAKCYDHMINSVQCYGFNDVRNSIGINLELESRGVELRNKLIFN